MRQRGIVIDDIRRTVAHPDRVHPDADDPELTHALRRFYRRHGSVVLRVVYNHTVSPRRVVTAFFDRRAGRSP
jgi:hypothetical protein